MDSKCLRCKGRGYFDDGLGDRACPDCFAGVNHFQLRDKLARALAVSDGHDWDEVGRERRSVLRALYGPRANAVLTVMVETQTARRRVA